jgi:hypothetical protein
VATGDTLYIPDSWHAANTETTCATITVQTGGVLVFDSAGGSRINPITMTQSGTGEVVMSASDTVELAGGAWNITSGTAILKINSATNHNDGTWTTQAVIGSLFSANRGYVRFNGTQTVEIDYAKFYVLGTGEGTTAGLTLGSSGSERNTSHGFVRHCRFDSASFVHYGISCWHESCSVKDHEWPCLVTLYGRQ